MGQNENCDISPLEYFKPDTYCGKFLQDYGKTISRVYREYRQSAHYDYYPFEELCQDVVVELMESQTVDFMGHGIVAKITKDKIVDKYRKMISYMSGMANHLNNDTDTELIDEVPSQHLTQLAEAMDEEKRRILEEAVHQVCTKRESQVFNLR
ncbi:sigma-70 family RNA polymerase sigma factor [Candidatus Poribacteria bacterium]|nr:sigma-70 family RNA polymerase sigma factor [Candidatus Poribacteria bacterium]